MSDGIKTQVSRPAMTLTCRIGLILLSPLCAYTAWYVAMKSAERMPEAFRSAPLSLALLVTFGLAGFSAWLSVFFIHCVLERVVVSPDGISVRGLWRTSFEWREVRMAHLGPSGLGLVMLRTWGQGRRRHDFTAGTPALLAAFKEIADIYDRRALTEPAPDAPITLTRRRALGELAGFAFFLGLGLFMLAGGVWYLHMAWKQPTLANRVVGLLVALAGIGCGGSCLYGFGLACRLAFRCRGVELHRDKLIVHWKGGRDEVFELPAAIDSFEPQDIGEFVVRLKQGKSFFAFANTDFRQDQCEVNRHLNAAFPMALVDGSGKVLGRTAMFSPPPPQGQFRLLATQDGRIYQRAPQQSR